MVRAYCMHIRFVRICFSAFLNEFFEQFSVAVASKRRSCMMSCNLASRHKAYYVRRLRPQLLEHAPIVITAIHAHVHVQNARLGRTARRAKCAASVVTSVAKAIFDRFCVKKLGKFKKNAFWTTNLLIWQPQKRFYGRKRIGEICLEKFVVSSPRSYGLQKFRPVKVSSVTRSTP